MFTAIREDDELHHGISRYDVRLLHSDTPGGIEPIEYTLRPIPLQDLITFVTPLDPPFRGLPSGITKILDDQARRYLSGANGFEPDLEYVGNLLPGSCKREPS